MSTDHGFGPERSEEEMDVIRELGYEPTDVEVRSAPKHVVWFFVSMFVMIGFSWLFMRVFSPDLTTSGERQDFVRDMVPEANAPLLQSNKTAEQDMHDLRAEEREKLEGLGWVDESQGVVQIPVLDAIEVLLENGLPTRPDAEPVQFGEQMPVDQSPDVQMPVEQMQGDELPDGDGGSE